MALNLNQQEFDLYRAVDEVLHFIWDPVGISHLPQARDEYRSYLPQIFSLLNSDIDEQALAAKLGRISTERMGLAASPEHDLKVARILLDWKAYFAQTTR